MRIFLRPVTINDGSMIVRWRNSAHVSNHCFNRNPITVESNAKFFNTYIETEKYKQFIVERIDEDFGVASYPIATVYLKDIDTVNNRCELCVFTSDDQEWNTESQSIAIQQLLEKAFNEYGIHKVYTYVFSDNSDEVELMKRAGLEKEAILKDEALNSEGRYTNVIRMSVLKDTN